MGNSLVVGVTRDKFVNKPGRPILPEKERLEMVRAVRWVAGALLCDDAVDAMRQWGPHIFCKGGDYIEKGLLPAEIKYCNENNIEIRFTKDYGQRTGKIIERIKHG